MAAAAAEVVLEVRPQPPPPPPAMDGLPDFPPRQAKTLMYLLLASLWVGSAAVAGAVVARRACGEDSPVRTALDLLSVGALLCDVLLIVVISVMASRAMRARGMRLFPSVSVAQARKEARKMLGELSWKVLQDTTVLGFLVFLSFQLLHAAGVLVYTGLLPVQESQKEKIGHALADVGLVGAQAMCCFIIVPSLALKLWRSK